MRFPVSQAKNESLRVRMEALGLKEGDFVETFFRCSGPGGQKTNKTETGVMLYHGATDVRVRCQRERSQGINRFLARRLLVEELEARREGKTRHEAQAERLRAGKHRLPQRDRIAEGIRKMIPSPDGAGGPASQSGEHGNSDRG